MAPVAIEAPAHSGRRLIGRGRSGKVYLSNRQDGSHVAVKVFRPDAVSTVVLTLLTGAPNPYRWNADAAECVVYRRRVLRVLVAYWFGGRLRVPATRGPEWNGEERAFEVESEFISSHHLPLLSGSPADRPESLDALVRDVMRPLQQHLREAGCVGLVWQAGFGNPVAGGNFMIDPTATRSEDKWIWIDLESGIPPLIPMNPLVLLRFYLPQMLRRRALLFDDIDVAALKSYISAHREGIEASCGDIASLWADVDQLSTTQRAWKALSRRERGVAYAQARGWIGADEARSYLRRPFRWYARQAGWAAKAIGRAIFGGAKVVLSKVIGARWLVYIRSVRSFVASQQFRTRVSRRYVARRLIAWKSRGFLDRASLRDLRASLGSDSAARDISDFGVHLALKAPVSIVQWWVLPPLFLVGAIDGMLLTAGVVFGESAVRTLYTGARTIQCWLAGHELPWVAMFVGMIPLVGVSAFPAQMLYSGTSREKRLSRFIVHDTFASIGRAVPIWGGNDSLIEHAFNRLPSLLFGRDTPNRTAGVPVTLVRLPARDAVEVDHSRR